MNEDSSLRADCSRCAGLCCVALPFSRSADFAVTKPAGRPCLNLASGVADFRCEIHPRLRSSGWRGCTVFDCFGAGQLVTQHTFGGRTWRSDPALAPAMFTAFEAMRRVQEIRYYLLTLRDLPLSPGLRTELDAVCARAQTLAYSCRNLSADAGSAASAGGESAAGPSMNDVQTLHDGVVPLLRAASRELRTPVLPRTGRARRLRAGADLLGADLRDLDLRGVDLRGALLVAADLRNTVLERADLLGADLRDANVAGADLRDALFVTQPQIAAARGDDSTRIPPRLSRPDHWAASEHLAAGVAVDPVGLPGWQGHPTR